MSSQNSPSNTNTAFKFIKTESKLNHTDSEENSKSRRPLELNEFSLNDSKITANKRSSLNKSSTEQENIEQTNTKTNELSNQTNNILYQQLCNQLLLSNSSSSASSIVNSNNLFFNNIQSGPSSSFQSSQFHNLFNNHQQNLFSNNMSLADQANFQQQLQQSNTNKQLNNYFNSRINDLINLPTPITPTSTSNLNSSLFKSQKEQKLCNGKPILCQSIFTQ